MDGEEEKEAKEEQKKEISENSKNNDFDEDIFPILHMLKPYSLFFRSYYFLKQQKLDKSLGRESHDMKWYFDQISKGRTFEIFCPF